MYIRTFDVGIESTQIDLRLFEPLVYVAYIGDRTLYVGMSEYGLHRVANPAHTAMQQALREGASIEVVFCKDVSHARLIERVLIKDRNPEYNRKKKKT